MDALGLIREFLKERLGVEPERVQPETELSKLGVDSLMLLELVFAFEDRAGIEIRPGAPTPRTVSQVMALADSLGGASR